MFLDLFFLKEFNFLLKISATSLNMIILNFALIFFLFLKLSSSHTDSTEFPDSPSDPISHCSWKVFQMHHQVSEKTVSNMVEGSWNALFGLSLFTLVFLCIFLAKSMGARGFLSCSGFLGDKILSLS